MNRYILIIVLSNVIKNDLKSGHVRINRHGINCKAVWN